MGGNDEVTGQPGQVPAGTEPGARPARAARPHVIVIVIAALAAAAALAVIGATVASGGPPARARSLGLAKNFTLSVLGHPGQRVSLASLRGRPVILNFFASWCSPCQRETPLIARFYAAGRGRLEVIGIDNNDQTAAAQAFVRRNGVRYPVLVDPLPMRTAIAYGLPGLPATFFLNARHQIVKRVFGALTPAELATGGRLITHRGR